ncbi:hypothetical protein C7S18_20945 [Ahniella affigens]|uniref:VCBS repeat-containing protein n=1 Tax=Ahniella affigens TaxID=2021234 RepID=A0A2P1PXC5_9GAMM|nr:VCBS repeat-containing protein [Ahniella affigens]AVP99487.1 hypothetical protein C7S18_20945 [Ahniella affigens]
MRSCKFVVLPLLMFSLFRVPADVSAACANYGFAPAPGGVTCPGGSCSVFVSTGVPGDAALADFNGDGYLDMATANVNITSLSVLLGLPNGNFSLSPQAVELGNGNLGQAIVSADFNGDQRADLAVVTRFHDIISLLGDGTGGFVSAGVIDVGSGSNTYSDITSGDFNGDGIVDLAATAPTLNAITIGLGLGNGQFQQPSGSPFGVSELNLPMSLAAGRIDSDNIDDLVVAGLESDNLVVLKSQGNGQFVVLQNESAVIAPEARPRQVELRDLNHDGRLDALVASHVFRNSGAVPLSPFNRAALFLGRNTGGLDAATFVDLGGDLDDVSAADFDADGAEDLLGANIAFSFRTSVARQTGAMIFETTPLALPGAGGASGGVYTGDFDRDGFVDVAGVMSSGYVNVSLNTCVQDALFANGFE